MVASTDRAFASRRRDVAMAGTVAAGIDTGYSPGGRIIVV
jgi:hypothetical protein